jgi:hypothetical protein
MFPFLTHVGSAQIQYFHPENCHLFTQNSFSVSPKGAKHKVAHISQKMSMILISGWWFQHLWKIWKSVGMILPNIWKVIKHVPNQQPVNFHAFHSFPLYGLRFIVAFLRWSKSPPVQNRWWLRPHVQDWGRDSTQKLHPVDRQGPVIDWGVTNWTN